MCVICCFVSCLALASGAGGGGGGARTGQQLAHHSNIVHILNFRSPLMSCYLLFPSRVLGYKNWLANVLEGVFFSEVDLVFMVRLLCVDWLAPIWHQRHGSGVVWDSVWSVDACVVSRGTVCSLGVRPAGAAVPGHHQCGHLSNNLVSGGCSSSCVQPLVPSRSCTVGYFSVYVGKANLPSDTFACYTI